METDLERRVRRIERQLDTLIYFTLPGKRARHVRLFEMKNGQKTGGKKMVVDGGSKRKIFAEFVDDDGNVAAIDGLPVWSASNSDAQLEVSEDGRSVMYVVPTAPGLYTVQCKADSDPSEGEAPIIGEIQYEVTPKMATKVVLRDEAA